MEAGCSHNSCDVVMTTEVMTSLASPGRRWTTIDAFDRLVTPLWYVIGIPGNIAACVVWIQASMRPSSGCYLAALAMDECVFLILQVDTCSCSVLINAEDLSIRPNLSVRLNIQF